MARNGNNKLQEDTMADANRNSGWQAALIGLSYEPIFAWDWDNGIVEWNAGAERQYGYTRAEVLGINSHELLATKHPVSLRRFLKKLAADGYWIGEVRHTTKDGRELIIESRQQVIRHEGKTIVVESNRDITERREGEGQIALLIIIGDLIRKINNPDELLFAASKAVGTYFKAKRCLFSEVEPEKDLEIVHRDYCNGVRSVAGRHKLSSYSAITSRDMIAGRTVSNADSKTDPRTAKLFKKTYQPTGERSYIAVPLMRDGQWKSTLWISDDKPRQWSEAEITLLEVVAERIWLAVEKRRNEESLRASRAELDLIITGTPFMLTHCSSDLRFKYVSRSCAEMLGRRQDDLIGAPIVNVLGKAAFEKIRPRVEAVLRGEVIEFEDEVPYLTGVRHVRVSYVPERDMKNKVIGWIASIVDITERKRADEALRKSEEQFSRFMQHLPGLAWIKDIDGHYVYANAAATKAFRVSREKLYGRTDEEIFPAEIAKQFKANDGQVMEEKKGIQAIETLEHKDGLLHSSIVNKFPISDGEGRTIQIGGMAFDISDRMRAEAALRESEESYRVLAESASDAILSIDENSTIGFVNTAATRIFGYSKKEMTGHSLTMLMPEELRPQHRAGFGRYLKTGEKKLNWEGVHIMARHKDGRHFPIEISFGEYIRGGMRFFIGIARDVTEQKKAIEALRESEQRRQLAQEAGEVGVFDWDIAADRTYWSETMWKFYGEEKTSINPDEAFWSAHIHDDDRERVITNLRRVVGSQGMEFRDEFRIVRSDGTLRWIEAKARVSRDGTGKATRVFGVNLDITSRKLAEEKIRASENQLRLVTASVPALISYVDKNECYRFANERFTDWFGIPNMEIIGKGPRDVFGTAAYKVLKPWIDKALTGQKCTFETVLSYKEIGDKYVSVSYIPDIGADGTVYGYYGLTHDLTELKHSEELLRSSEERIGLIADSFTDYAIFSTDINGQIDSWNRGAETIFGYSREEVFGRSYEFVFTPEDTARGVWKKEMRNSRLKGRASYEGWRLKKDGSRFFASSVMAPLYVGKTLTGYAKIVSDLTEKKRHAEELQRAHDELELRVKERTKELDELIAALVQEMREREIAEKQRFELLGRLISSQEFERRRFARDLHDQMGQQLTALRLKIASLHELSPQDTQYADRVNRLQEIAERIDSEVSFLAWELRPAALDDLGLLDAIKAFVNEWSHHHEIASDFQTAGISKDRLDREVETHLYRITQEALNNIAKHADAKHVTVLLEKREQNIMLIVEDDGKGFDATKKYISSESGLGLVGMSERAALIGGEIEIESARGKGTTIFVRVPLIK